MMTLHPLGALSFQFDHRNLEASQGAEPRRPTWFCFFPRKHTDPPPPGDRGGGPSFRSYGLVERFSQSERPGRTSRKLVLHPRESYYLALRRSRPTGQIKGTIEVHQSEYDPPPVRPAGATNQVAASTKATKAETRVIRIPKLGLLLVIVADPVIILRRLNRSRPTSRRTVFQTHQDNLQKTFTNTKRAVPALGVHGQFGTKVASMRPSETVVHTYRTDCAELKKTV
jgi:hypothetical protein